MCFSKFIYLFLAALGLHCCTRALEHRLISCETWAWLPCDIWDLPRSEVK